MGEATGIEWTDHTFNPWWGCARVSPGCEHCYAETWDAFVQAKTPHWGTKAPRRFFGEDKWNEPVRWNEAAELAGVRRRVFCASMADVFEDRADLVAERERLWSLIRRTPSLDWLLLTKRPENILRMIPWVVFSQGVPVVADAPWPNVWLGTTAEDQRRADERLPVLLKVPAAVRFVSYEPALEHVNFRGHIMSPPRVADCTCGHGHGFTRCPNYGMVARRCHHDGCACPGFVRAPGKGLDWLIIGGEGGGGARPFDLAWASDVLKQCRDTGTVPFVKQAGSRAVTSNANLFDWPRGGAELREDGEGAASALVKLRARKGGDPAEWPEPLRVREFPRAGGAA